MRLEFQPQIVRDLKGIGDYIADDNSVRAVSVVLILSRLIVKFFHINTTLTVWDWPD